ncbi:caspase-1-like [Ischnura elegans]|uniref:caspase-1-like n=1 Tax=Ischnura elegans TaxID=197161 RepID=UPI001ED89586|nr:caspase-1-like [Ischnura elegans]
MTKDGRACLEIPSEMNLMETYAPSETLSKGKEEPDTAVFRADLKVSENNEYINGKTIAEAKHISQKLILTRYYYMNYGRRGKCLIFAHEKFDYSENGLNGSFDDGEKMLKTAKALGFDAELCKDFKYSAIIAKIREVAAEDHSDADCIMLVFITKGDQGYIHSRNNSYSLKGVWSLLKPSKCPTLMGKPKLFFIQISEKNYIPVDRCFSPRLDAAAASYSFPDSSDFFFATCNKNTNLPDGTKDANKSYIQTLCEELENPENRGTDLIRIVLRIHSKFERKAQNELPYFNSTLIRPLYFTKKEMNGTAHGSRANLTHENNCWESMTD